MRILSRAIFREVFQSTMLGALLFTFVLFLQRVGKLFEILVRTSATPQTVLQLFGLAVPFTLSFTMPLGVLVGVLIALSRMSSDGEITAMRAAGVSSRKVVAPVLAFATLAFLITAFNSLWLTPYATWRTYKILNQLVASELTAEVQPRVFEEQFPNRVIYVDDITPGAVPRWRNVFIADITPPGERKDTGQDLGELPFISVASQAIAAPDVAHNRIQLSMLNGSTHKIGKDFTEYYKTEFPVGDELLEATKPNEVHARGYTEMDTVPLYKTAYKDPKLEPEKRIEALIELHERFALPPACILLALIGVPLGVSSRKGGKSMAFVLTVVVAFMYWMGLIAMQGLARQRKLPVGLAEWTPNIVFAIIGVFLIVRLEKPGDRDIIGQLRDLFLSIGRFFRRLFQARPAVLPFSRRPRLRLPLVPQVVDTYVLSVFLFYFVVFLVSFIVMTHVYTFFELLSDMVKNNIPMSRMLTYLFFLTPKLIYDSTPVSVLVAVLITFGVLTKHNEVTAFKACGISVYRLSVPILVASCILSGGLFAFDHYEVPKANRKQDALRNEIKGKPVQTYLRPDRKWIVGHGSRIYYYKFLDPVQKVMAGVNVYELDPATFSLKRYIYADKAHWEPLLHTWVFESGWCRDLALRKERFQNFSGRVATFSEVDEPPEYFLKEVLQDKQMNFQQLAAYIRELRQSGFDTIPLQVQFYRKFSVPLFALIMALISLPFAFLAGNRGAMAGVGISFGIAIAYWAISLLFEQIGNVNLLPAAIAAWSPDAVFTLAGLYFFSRMTT